MLRRHFLRTAAAGPALLVSSGARAAAEYDLVIRNGRLLDPGRGFDAPADIAVRAGKIAAIRPHIPATAAAEVIDASGLLVVPGLIDLHVHARDKAFPPAEYLRTGGVTTLCDAGSRGADNLDDVLELARAAPNRLRLWLNIAHLGNNLPTGRGEFLESIDPANVEKCVAAIARHRQWIIGVKARLSRLASADRDMEVLRRAVAAATLARVPLMIHIGDTATPLPRILALLRPGDIVTHLYAPANGILDREGRLLPEVSAARRRGVRFDFGQGRTEHWDWKTAEAAIGQGFLPDTISTDLDIVGRAQQVFDLPNVLSKFLLLGVPLAQVIAMATINAARSVAEFQKLGLGSLKPGSPADITILELADGSYEFVDNYKNTRQGPRKLILKYAMAQGRLAPAP
jgi:dihydroorotase